MYPFILYSKNNNVSITIYIFIHLVNKSLLYILKINFLHQSTNLIIIKYIIIYNRLEQIY